jgi:hypothetical protein
MRRGNRRRRGLEIGWNANILRKMIERAERQDAERRVGTDEGGRDRADGAVSAGSDDDPASILQRVARACMEVASAPR